MRIKTFLPLAIIMLLFTANISAQSKKELKQRKLEMLVKMRALIASGKSDSLIDYVKALTSVADTSVQTYESTTQSGGVLEMIVLDGDTVYIYNMQTFTVVDLQPYGNVLKDRKFRKLRFHVKKTYPYAKIAADNLTKYNKQLETVTSKRKRRKIMKLREKVLKEEFEDVIKDMSQTSGRVLIKLIDRETGQSTYEIIKEMRGGFKAWTYQGVGKLYGANLKQRYDPKNNEEDEMIERVVQSLIDEGSISY